MSTPEEDENKVEPSYAEQYWSYPDSNVYLHVQQTKINKHELSEVLKGHLRAHIKPILDNDKL